MKFYKSFLFLFIFNLCFILPTWFLFKVQFLIPLFVFLSALNLFLIFSSFLYFTKQNFTAFPPDDPYSVSKIFENLKTDYKISNVQLLKTSNTNYSIFYFSGGNKSFIVLSEKLLECFSKKDIRYLLSYPFQMIQTGDLFFLSLLSGFLFLIEKILYGLNYPLRLILRRPYKKEMFSLILLLKSCSFITKKLYRNLDKSFSNQKQDMEKQSLVLWKLHSLTKVCPPKMPFFTAPLFLTNPLTDSQWECYISLQPFIKERIEALNMAYPP